MTDVIVVIGPGQIGQAIARRVGIGKHVLLAEMRRENADAAAKVMGDAGYDVSVATVDVSSREDVHALVQKAAGLGDVGKLIHAAGVSPSQAQPATILRVDLYGTALVLEEFGNVIAHGGAGEWRKRTNTKWSSSPGPAAVWARQRPATSLRRERSWYSAQGAPTVSGGSPLGLGLATKLLCRPM